MIEALLSIRIPELWVTKISEEYSVDISCEVGGSSGKIGWGLATIRGNEDILEQIIEEVRNHPSVGKIKIRTREKGLVKFLVDVVKCRACEVLIKSKSFMVFPVQIHKGRMKWLIITDNNITIGKISRELEKKDCEVNIEKVTPLRQKGLLTDRQDEVIRKAFEGGYFNFPRKMDTEELSKNLGISLSTLSEIMRAAQRRIISQYLKK